MNLVYPPNPMPNRQPMTTETLQKKFPDIYRKFFGEHNIVVSANNVINRWNWVWESFNNFKILQKVPSKTYCGINYNKTWKVRVKYVYQYDWVHTNNFVYKDIDQIVYNIQNVCAHIEKQFELEKKPGIDISFLCENQSGHGFSIPSLITLLMAFVSCYVSGDIDAEMLEDYDSFLKSEKFKNLYYKAWNFADVVSEAKSNWAAAYVSLHNYDLPMIYVSKNVRDNPIYETDQEKSETFAMPLHEFLGVKRPKELPVDFGVVYCGVDYDANHLYWLMQKYKNEIDIVQSYIFNKLEKNQIKKIPFYFGDLNKDTFYDSFVNVGTIFHIKLLKAFDDLLNNSYNEKFMESLINNISEFGAFSTIVESENKMKHFIKESFEKNKIFEDEKIGICPLTSGKSGGSFLFVTKYQKSRTTVQRMIKDLYAKYGKSVFLEYCSWADWYSQDWISLNQDLSKNIYSDFVKSGSVLYKDNKWNSYIDDYDNIIKKEKWILIDVVGKKIYINWKELNSKYLHSKSTTIEILEHLVVNHGEKLNNSDLPASSYSKQRNQMVGKIILPFKEMVKELFDRDLKLECTWNLYEYDIVLDEKIIKIGVVKEI
jgi:hypothetical protein